MSQPLKFGPPLPAVELPESSLAPDWQQAKPASIARALRRALERPHGNWYVVDASRRLGETPRRLRALRIFWARSCTNDLMSGRGSTC